MSLFRGVAEVALYCAHRTTTALSWGLCEQERRLKGSDPFNLPGHTYSIYYRAFHTLGPRQLARWCTTQRSGDGSIVFGSILRGLGARKDRRPAAIASTSERAPLLCIASLTNEPRLTSASGRRVTRQVKV
jgi:hypothetical protein